MRQRSAEMVGPERAAFAAHFPVGCEHEVVNDQLTATRKQIRERLATNCAFECVVGGDAVPGQIAPGLAQLIAQFHELLFLGEQRAASETPLIGRYDGVCGHGALLTIGISEIWAEVGVYGRAVSPTRDV